MIKVAKIIITAALVGALTACGTLHSFKKAKLSESEPTQTISGLLAKPSGDGAFSAVALLHTCGGLTKVTTADWPEYLTGLGYVTFAVDSFGSRGIRRCPTPLSRDLRELSRDAYGALEYLASLPVIDKGGIGVIGFSLGGNTIGYFAGLGFKTPSGLDFKAAVSLYGRCNYLVGYPKTIPTTVIIGELENEGRLAPCKTLARQSPPSIKIDLLPDTYHSFDNPQYTTITIDSEGNPALYNWEATKKAREIAKAFLAEHLGK